MLRALTFIWASRVAELQCLRPTCRTACQLKARLHRVMSSCRLCSMRTWRSYGRLGRSCSSVATLRTGAEEAALADKACRFCCCSFCLSGSRTISKFGGYGAYTRPLSRSLPVRQRPVLQDSELNHGVRRHGHRRNSSSQPRNGGAEHDLVQIDHPPQRPPSSDHP